MGARKKTPTNRVVTPINRDGGANLPLSPGQSKYNLRSLMCPRNDILQHPAANMLMEYATNSCPVDCGDNWSLTRIEEAIKHGAHPSAREPLAAKACWEEALA